MRNSFFRRTFFFQVFLLALAGILLGTVCGSEFYSIKELFFPEGTFAPTLLAKSRLLQSAGAFLAGASLALAGAVYQAVLRNILAEPYILGVSSGSALGAALAFITGAVLISPYAIALFAALGALGALFWCFFWGSGRKAPAKICFFPGSLWGRSFPVCLWRQSRWHPQGRCADLPGGSWGIFPLWIRGCLPPSG